MAIPHRVCCRSWMVVRSGASFSHSFVYSFHMPAFFFVSGLFAMGSIAKRGARHFTADKLRTILYPYVLFAIISAAFEPLIGRYEFETKPFHWNGFLVNLADGQASWFLFVLFFCLMLLLMSARVPSWPRFLVAVLVGVAAPFGIPGISEVLREFCFLAAGTCVGQQIYRLDGMRLATAGAGFVALATFQAVMVSIFGTSVLGRWIYVEAGLTGTAGLFCWRSYWINIDSAMALHGLEELRWRCFC